MTNQELPNTGPSDTLYKGLFGPAMTIGFAASIIMWIFAWVLHMPGVHVNSWIAIPILLIPLLAICLLWLPGVVAHNRIKVGGLGGLIAGLINLMILGSDIVKQPDSTAQMSEQANALAPNAVVVILGSLAVSMVIGLVAGVIVAKNESRTIQPATTWRSRFAWVTALTYVPLIAIGGVVTTTDSGLAVPDATTTYGAISVLFPLKLMAEPHIFFEHSHRLFGTLAGLTTLVFMIRLLVSEPRKVPKAMGVLMFLAVSIQGYMGIIRVADKSTFWAIIHGVFAQLVLSLAFGTAVILSKSYVKANPSDEVVKGSKTARLFMVLCFVTLVIQLVLGALTRHLNSPHAMMAHMGFAFLATILVIVGGAMCMRAGKNDQTGKSIRPYGGILHGLVVLQFSLGFAVLGLAWQGKDAPELLTPETLDTAPNIETIPALVTTAHHINGALLLAAACGAMIWSIRLASKRKIR